MIKRHYFYQVDMGEKLNKFAWGIISVKSLFPNPENAIEQLAIDYKENGNVKVITFNRV